MSTVRDVFNLRPIAADDAALYAAFFLALLLFHHFPDALSKILGVRCSNCHCTTKRNIFYMYVEQQIFVQSFSHSRCQ